ncbi:MAG: glycosyltransferase [Acidobacteria bacterium]|nr:glycosyltransferase [Acidobacteriota bacterium]
MQLDPLRSPQVAIIIPVRKINAYVRESVPHILNLNYGNFEVLILPDAAETGEFFPGGGRVKILPTGAVGPAEKRDMALRFSDAQVLAFLDDDAYPTADWLDHALLHFEDPGVGAVGGPAVTPVDDNLWQKASGEVFSTWLGGGVFAYRYVPQRKREVDDYPSVNFLIRRDVFEKAGGFDSTFWPGEDTKLCLAVTKELGLKIIYDPNVFVWHHRRELFLPHLRQITNYALHRGFFAKVYPDTSLRASYFLPSAFTITLLAALPAVFSSSPLLRLPLMLVTAYGALLIVSVAAVSARTRSLALGLLSGAGIFTTHFCYGLYFIKGLLTRRLVR